jgi:hypothetical protein
VQAKSPVLARFSPQMLDYLHEIKTKEDAANLSRATVTVEELGTVEEQQQHQQEQQQKDEDQ